MQRITTKTSVTQHHDGVTMVRVEEKCYTTTVNEFLTEVEGIISWIPVNFEKERMSDFQAMLDPFLRGLNKDEFHNSHTEIYNSGIIMEKHPKFKPCLDSFLNSLPSNFEHYIHDILVHSYVCEFVTSFALDNRVAIAIGVSLFVEIYPLMKQTGGLKSIFRSPS